MSSTTPQPIILVRPASFDLRAQQGEARTTLRTTLTQLRLDGVAYVGQGGATVSTMPCVPTLMAGQLATLDSDGRAVTTDCGQRQTAVGIALQVAGSVARIQFDGAAPYAPGGLVPMQDYFLGADGLPTAELTDDILYVQRLGVALDAETLLLSLRGIGYKRCLP